MYRLREVLLSALRNGLIAAVAAVVVASGCLADPVSNADLATIHTLGVVSQLGDQAEIRKVGITVFGNRQTYLPLGDWALDKVVAQQMSDTMSARFEIKVAPFGVSVFKDAKPNLIHSFFGSRESPFAAFPDSGLDAYLVVLPAFVALPYPSNQSVSGVGLLHMVGAQSDVPGVLPPAFFDFSARKSGIIFVIYDIYLVNANTGRIIYTHQGEIPNNYHETLAQLMWNGAPNAPIRYPHPHLFVPDNIWPETAETMTDAQKDMFRAELTKLIKISVSYSLEQMGFVPHQPAMPSIGQTNLTGLPSPK